MRSCFVATHPRHCVGIFDVTKEPHSKLTMHILFALVAIRDRPGLGLRSHYSCLSMARYDLPEAHTDAMQMLLLLDCVQSPSPHAGSRLGRLEINIDFRCVSADPCVRQMPPHADVAMASRSYTKPSVLKCPSNLRYLDPKRNVGSVDEQGT